MVKEKNEECTNICPYYCEVAISRLDKIEPVTIGHISTEVSRYVSYFLPESGSVTGSVADIHHRVPPIPEGGLEIPTLMHFVHCKKH